MVLGAVEGRALLSAHTAWNKPETWLVQKAAREEKEDTGLEEGEQSVAGD